MKLYPWNEIVASTNDLIKQGMECYQQFNCDHCGAKQTMDIPNMFYEIGTCEECGKDTNIKQHGMNFMVHARTPEAADALLKLMKGKR